METFEILSQRSERATVGTRIIYKLRCSEGHEFESRKSYFSKLRICKYCSKSYRKMSEFALLECMRQRCYNPNNSQYASYGGKGVVVCPKWLQPNYFGIREFIKDMGKRPENMSLDREDVNGNYEPANCRWATASVQAFNKGIFKTNTSGRTGVYLRKRKNDTIWVAYIMVQGKNIFLGQSEVFADAVKFREAGELRYFGVTKC